ncbi:hypothetical protein ACI65C_013315 [Semiaphis heraclei]
MGYSNYVQQQREAKMCLRMCAVLALLPAHQIEQGFQDIKMHAQNNGVLMPRFFTYFSSFWITRKGPECFSVYNQPRRTNNNVESFHSNLKQTFQVTNPNLWRMLDHLKNISIKQHIVINQLAAGMVTTRNTKMKFVLNSLRIKHSTGLLSTGAITIKEFLLQCSHCVDGYLTRELNWHDATNDSEDDLQGETLNAPLPTIPDAEAAILNIPAMNNGEDSEDEVQDGQMNTLPHAVPNAEFDRNPGVIDIDGPEQNENETDTVYNEANFFVPEDLAVAFWVENYERDDEDEVPYAPIPQNIGDHLPQGNEEDICVICRDSPRTHALVPCGHKVLCFDCVSRLDFERCPICNNNFTLAIRIWQ